MSKFWSQKKIPRHCKPSALSLKLILMTFFSLLLLQALLFLPVYIQFKKEALDTLEMRSEDSLRTFILTLDDNQNNDIVSKAKRLLEKNPFIKGLVLTNPAGEVLVNLGEKPAYPINRLSPLIEIIMLLFEEQSSRIDVVLNNQNLQAPYEALLRLDTSNTAPILNQIFSNLIIGIILYSAILTILFLLITHYYLLDPLLLLRKQFFKITQDPKNLTQHFISHHRHDELGDIFNQFNIVAHKLENNNKTIKAHEAILAMNADERSQALYQITNYHPLTGLANRHLLKEELNKFIELARGENKQISVFIMELRDFHEIVHAFGQNLGDLFLKEVAKLLVENAPQNTLVAHLSTIRFALVKNNITNSSQVITLAQWLIDLFSKPTPVGTQNIITTINLGIALYPNEGGDGDPESLLKDATLALNHAKEVGPNSYQFHEAKMNQTIEQRRSMLTELHYALEKEQLRVFYQPQISLKTKKLLGFEALIRWEHPEKGRISPTQFIPLAEESGLIISITEWVLKTACAQTRLWQTQGFLDLTIAINLSSVQFKQKNVVEMINRTLIETELTSGSLEIEITESGIMNNPKEAIIIMKALHALGVMISIDDFGTGYSSLSYLKQFPVQKLKIDQSFVKELGNTHIEKPLADMIILLGHSLNLRVIAEGVETKTQFDYLIEKGCDEVQGYYFGEPMPPEHCENYFKTLT